MKNSLLFESVWVIKGNSVSNLFIAILMIVVLTCHITSPSTLRLPCFEEVKPHREAVFRLSGQ